MHKIFSGGLLMEAPSPNGSLSAIKEVLKIELQYFSIA